MSVLEISCSGQLHQGAKLPTTEFYVNRNTKRGYRSKCKACFHLYDKNRAVTIKRLHLTEKKCGDCGRLLPIGDFYRSSRLRTGYRPECKTCYSLRRGERPSRAIKCTPQEKEMLKLTKALNPYKLTVRKYYEMLEAQGGVCAVCRGDNGGKRLVVDHNHSCCPGRKSCGSCVRSLLCSFCNIGLGAFRDNIQLMQAASQYLISHAGKC